MKITCKKIPRNIYVYCYGPVKIASPPVLVDELCYYPEIL
jgi:hypothetical protein